jgi:hypothetical protein
MVVALVLIALIGAASASVVLWAYGFPLWMVLLAYPVTGSLILLPGVALFAWITHIPRDGQSSQGVTSQSPAAPHPRSPTGSSNP